MTDRDGTHADPAPQRPRGRNRDGRLLRRTTSALVMAVLAAAAASYELELGERLGIAEPDAKHNPAAVAPPPGLELPTATTAPPVAAVATPADANPAAVRAAVQRLARYRKLGKRVTVAVREVGSGRSMFSTGPAVVTPASTMKLLTTAAALHELGPDHRFVTSAALRRRQVVLVGGGDPLLTRAPLDDDSYPERADLATLARQTARALERRGLARVRLGYDSTLFTGPAVSPDWEPDYVPQDVVSPVSSLWVDEGRERAGFAARSPDPAAAAAMVFASALRQRGIAVVGAPVPAVATPAATTVATVESAPLAQIVEHTLEISDNEAAEVLARHVALGRGRPASFGGAAAAVRGSLTDLRVDLTGAVIEDGSGLARSDRLGYYSLLDVLGSAAADQELRTVLSGLPVAGFSGSLAYRFETAPREALGDVRAKTGTLTGVSGLAGSVVTRDGALLAFVAVADRVKPVNTLDARARLEEIAGALAACLCAGA